MRKDRSSAAKVVLTENSAVQSGQKRIQATRSKAVGEKTGR